MQQIQRYDSNLILYFDSSLNIIEWDANLEKLFGVKRADSINKPLYTVLPALHIYDFCIQKYILEQHSSIEISNIPIFVEAQQKDFSFKANLTSVVEQNKFVSGILLLQVKTLQSLTHYENLSFNKSIIDNMEDGMLLLSYNTNNDTLSDLTTTSEKSERLELKKFEIIYANPAFCTMTGLSEQEIIGKSPDFFTQSLTKPETKEFLINTLDNTQFFSHDLMFYTKKGKPIWITLTIIPLKNNKTRWLAIHRDITVQKEAEEKQYKYLFEHTSSAIIRLDKKLNFVDSNEGFVKMFGYTIAEMKTLPIKLKDFISEETYEQTVDYFRQLMKHEVESITVENKHKTRAGKIFETVGNALGLYDENNEFNGALVIINDISEAKESEKKLIKVNEKLSSFAHKISHDLKEPLNSIVYFSKTLKLETEGNLYTEEQEYLKRIIQGAERARAFIDDILYFSEITETDYILNKVDLNEVLQIVMHNLHEQIKKRQAYISVEYLPTIYGNPTLLVQLFQNLLSNSLKYTDASKKPTIRITNIQDELFVKIRIVDNGKGIKKSESEMVFQPFIRGSSTKGLHGLGSGLGLSICRKIMDFLEGTISIESPKNQGTIIELGFVKHSDLGEETILDF